MAKKGKGKTKTIVKYRKSKPQIKYRTKQVKKVVYRKARSSFAGMNIGGVVKDAVPLFFGALICKFCAKKFGGHGQLNPKTGAIVGGGEGENWTWKNYAWGMGSTFGAS